MYAMIEGYQHCENHIEILSECNFPEMSNMKYPAGDNSHGNKRHSPELPALAYGFKYSAKTRHCDDQQNQIMGFVYLTQILVQIFFLIKIHKNKKTGK